jgi:hypothetical protein
MITKQIHWSLHTGTAFLSQDNIRIINASGAVIDTLHASQSSVPLQQVFDNIPSDVSNYILGG